MIIPEFCTEVNIADFGQSLDGWPPLALAVDDTTGLVLTVDKLSAGGAENLKEWLEPIAEAVDAELLFGDDADAFKTVAQEMGLEHQVCKSHVMSNTETFIVNLEPRWSRMSMARWRRLGSRRASAGRPVAARRTDPQSPAGRGDRTGRDA